MAKLRIGLDIGYSETTRTCGIAVDADVLPANGGTAVLVPRRDAKNIFAKRMKLSEAKNWLCQLRANGLLEDAVIVADGMLGPNGPPVDERRVDQVCMTGKFANRAVAASVVGGGQRLVRATYELAAAAAGCISGPCFRFSPAYDLTTKGLCLYEANPVIGLAVITPMVQDVALLPSRSRAVDFNGTRIRAKSDYYWICGGGQRVAEILGAPAVADVRDHELRAGLFCLAAGVQLMGEAADNSRAICVGDPKSGTYLLIGPLHPDWEAEVTRIGIVAP